MAANGPDSFAFGNDGSVVLNNSNAPSAGPQTSISGGPGAFTADAPGGQFQQAAATSFQTIDAVNKLTDGALQPYIDAQQKEAYFQGMAKVAQGTTLQQIESDAPWYTQIFGPSATVRGAQAMTATSALTQAQTDFLTNMPTLRQQSPDDVRQYLVQTASNVSSTGDPLVDSLVQAKLGEALPQMLATHMKEHIAWQQEDMLKQQVNGNISNGLNVKAQRAATAATGFDPDAQSAAYANIVAQASPAFGQDNDSWSRGQVASLTSNLEQGNFDYYNAIRQSPLWDQIDPLARTKLESAQQLYVQKDALTNPALQSVMQSKDALSFAAEHGTSGLSTHADLDAAIDAMNKTTAETTGSTASLIDNPARAKLHEQFDAGNFAMQKLLVASQAKQANSNQQGSLVLSAFNSGNPAILGGQEIPSNVAAPVMDSVFSNAVSKNDPAQLQTVFDKFAQSSTDAKLRSPQLQNLMTTQLGALVSGNGPVTPNQTQALGYAQMLLHSPNGAAALKNYAGDSAEGVVHLLSGGYDINDPKQLTAARELISRGKGAVVTSADKQAAKDLISTANPGAVSQMLPWRGPNTLTPYDLNDDSVNRLSELAAPDLAMTMKAFGIGADTAGPMVMNSLLRNADFVPGSFVTRNPSVKGDGSLSTAVNQITPGYGVQSTSVYQDSLKELINESLTNKVEANGADMSHFSPDDYQVSGGEQIGGGSLLLFLWPKDKSRVGTGPQYVRIDPQALAARIGQNTGKKLPDPVSRNPSDPIPGPF